MLSASFLNQPTHLMKKYMSTANEPLVKANVINQFCIIFCQSALLSIHKIKILINFLRIIYFWTVFQKKTTDLRRSTAHELCEWISTNMLTTLGAHEDNRFLNRVYFRCPLNHNQVKVFDCARTNTNKGDEIYSCSILLVMLVGFFFEEWMLKIN